MINSLIKVAEKYSRKTIETMIDKFEIRNDEDKLKQTYNELLKQYEKEFGKYEEDDMTNLKFEIVKDEHRKHLDKEIIMPKRATVGSSGYDISVPVDLILEPGQRVLVFTDIKAAMDRDCELLLFMRSSWGKKGLEFQNQIPKIDSDYYGNSSNDGNIGLLLKNGGTETIKIEANKPICQGSFYRFLKTVDDESNTERSGGIGSTTL